MCGNFGLLLLSQSAATATLTNNSSHPPQPKPNVQQDALDHSLSRSMHQVAQANGILLASEIQENSVSKKKEAVVELLPAIKILEAQTAATEIRGGQAGGYSALEYMRHEAASTYESRFGVGSVYEEPANTRVRCVARKRHPLASDLAKLFINTKKRDFHKKTTVTVIGHTRFATSSQNLVPELHPHEWVPFHYETVWLFNNSTGVFERHSRNVGINITHNGDFDALEAYGQEVTVGDVGLWLERVLHVPNNLNGDSPKVAGCMDLFRVQGRLAAAARLAYVRVILGSVNDVSNNNELTKSAPNTMPSLSYFTLWENFIEELWRQHMNNIIKILPPGIDGMNGANSKPQYRYMVDRKAMKQFVNHAVSLLTPPKPLHQDDQVNHLVDQHHHNVPGYQPLNTASSSKQASSLGQKLALPSFMHDLNESIHGLSKSLHSNFNTRTGYDHVAYDPSYEQTNKLRSELKVESWSAKTLSSYISTLLRGFLYHDTYNAVIEFLSRATGSFGLQVHCSLEPGVVVIGSKGQPMSLSYDHHHPIVLFASEASALAVPVDHNQQWLKKRIDLDSHGEIIRIGEPRSFVEGSFKPVNLHHDSSPSSSEQQTDQLMNEATSRKPFSATSSDQKESSNDESSSLSSRSTATVSYKNPAIYPSFPIDPRITQPSSTSSHLNRSAYDLLNDRISTHEKLRTRTNSITSSIHGHHQSTSSPHDRSYQQVLSYLNNSHHSSKGNNSNHGSVKHPHQVNQQGKHQLNDSFHDGTSPNPRPPTRAIHMLSSSDMLEPSSSSTSLRQASSPPNMQSIHTLYPPPSSNIIVPNNSCLILPCGIELRSYNLTLCGEQDANQLTSRSSDMLISPQPYDPHLDLIAKDLHEIPATLAMINKAWNDTSSIEYMTSESLSETLFACIKHRMKTTHKGLAPLFASQSLPLLTTA